MLKTGHEISPRLPLAKPLSFLPFTASSLFGLVKPVPRPVPAKAGLLERPQPVKSGEAGTGPTRSHAQGGTPEHGEHGEDPPFDRRGRGDISDLPGRRGNARAWHGAGIADWPQSVPAEVDAEWNAW